jgi:hypothetical protein
MFASTDVRLDQMLHAGCLGGTRYDRIGGPGAEDVRDVDPIQQLGEPIGAAVN